MIIVDGIVCFDINVDLVDMCMDVNFEEVFFVFFLEVKEYDNCMEGVFE